jgi:hypothetical protein
MSHKPRPPRLCPDCITNYCENRQHRCPDCKAKRDAAQHAKFLKAQQASYYENKAKGILKYTPKPKPAIPEPRLCPDCKTDYCLGEAHRCPKCKRARYLAQKAEAYERYTENVEAGKLEKRNRKKSARKSRRQGLDISGNMASNDQIERNIRALELLAAQPGYHLHNYAGICAGIAEMRTE